MLFPPKYFKAYVCFATASFSLTKTEHITNTGYSLRPGPKVNRTSNRVTADPAWTWVMKWTLVSCSDMEVICYGSVAQLSWQLQRIKSNLEFFLFIQINFCNGMVMIRNIYWGLLVHPTLSSGKIKIKNHWDTAL